MRRRQRVALVLGGLAAALVAYEAFVSFVAYTDDAFVRSDLVAVAPQVTGPIIAVHVRDNQPVRQGDPLVTIDPVPFQLVVSARQAAIDEARAQVASDAPAVQTARDGYDAAVATAAFAGESQQRIAALNRTGDAPRESLDRVNEQLRVAQAALESATAGVARAQADSALHAAMLARAEAAMATAQWQLARTQLAAPTDGTVNALTVRVGDTARESEPLIGIVDAHAWRIIANYKQDYIRQFRDGATAWVWLDSQPWTVHRARIAGVARGISRETAADKLLPYVAPTTDWIRLQRRFPVTITLDDATGLTLFMGADARTVIFP